MNHHNHDIDIVIFHGDDTSFPGNGQIAITIDTELDLTGMSAHFQLCNFVQTFPVIPEDKTLLINIPASYTEKFPVGCTFAKVWLLDATGLKRTLANTLSVLITNRVDLAYATDTTQLVTVSVKGVVTWESIQGKPNVVLSVNGNEPDENGNVEVEAGLPECTIQDMPEEFTEDEMRLKVNEIIDWCKGGTAMIAAILSLSALGEPTVNLTVEMAQKGKILNTANIVTNVSATLSGMEDLASVETVSNIVEGYGFATTSITNGLRSYADLSYNTNFVTVVREATGDEPWTVVYNGYTYILSKIATLVWSSPYPQNPQDGDLVLRLTATPTGDTWESGLVVEMYTGGAWPSFDAGLDGGDGDLNIVTNMLFAMSVGNATATRELTETVITNTVTNAIALVTITNGLATTSSVAAVSGTASEALSKAETAGLNAGIAEGKANAALEALPHKQDALPYPTNAIPYAVLTDTPTIPTVPTQVSAFNNDAGYVNAETATNIAESAVACADTTYRLTIGVTNLNQSVQYVALDDTTTELAIALPTGDGAKDWLVYVNAATNTTLILPAATWWMSDEAFTNALPAGLTALYFSQISTNGVYSLGRQEMTPITIP